MKGWRWICMFITICTRLLFSSCKLCSSFWLMAAPLVHAYQQIKSWFIAITYTYKVAGTYLYAIFSKHSAELLLCILCEWLYLFYIRPLGFSFDVCVCVCVSTSVFHFFYACTMHVGWVPGRTMVVEHTTPESVEVSAHTHTHTHSYSGSERATKSERMVCLWWCSLRSSHSFRTSLVAHLHYRQVIC